MRLVDIYLLGYFTLIAGALYTLYRSNVLQQLPQAWIVGTVLLATAAGVLLRLASGKTKAPEDNSNR